MSLARASIIVCTMATERRAPLLRRALASIVDGQDGLARPIVVVNGTRVDRDLRAELAARSDLTFLYRAEQGLAGALRAGRALVDTPFFATLDDDDELLTGAIAARLEPLLEDPAIDLVVTNGYLDEGGKETLQYPELARFAEDPVRNVLALDDCWLQSVNAMYRSSRVTGADMRDMPDFLEWTWLALKLAPSRNICFLDRPTYRLNRREGDSLSLSTRYMHGVPDAIRAILKLDLPPEVRRILRRRLSSALHNSSEVARKAGEPGRAWRNHLASLLVGDGWRWLSYSRRLLRPNSVRHVESHANGTQS